MKWKSVIETLTHGTQTLWAKSRWWIVHEWGLSYSHKSNASIYHCNDSIISAMASKITGVSVVCHTCLFRRRQKKFKAPRHWALLEEFTGHRYIKWYSATSVTYIMFTWYPIAPISLAIDCVTRIVDMYHLCVPHVWWNKLSKISLLQNR